MGLSIFDTLSFAPKLGLIMGKSAFAVVGGPFRGSNQAKEYGDYVTIKMTNALVTTLSVAQLQAIMPPFEKNYRAWAQKKKIPADVEDVPGTEIRGFWIGDKKTAKTVMVYYHGGGFVMPGVPQHIDMLARWVEWGNGKLAVFVPCYTLSPEAIYPKAIGECVEALRYVYDNYGDRDILIGGDSAGGNLVCAMLSHTGGHSHPNTALVKELKLKKPLKGALLIAPWVSSDGDKFPGAVENGYRDIVTVWRARYWLDTYEGGRGKQEDEFTMPEIAEASWWKGTQAVVGSVLVTAGEMEALRDPIKAWVEKFEEGFGKEKLKFVLADYEIHDAPVSKPFPMDVITADTNGTRTQEGAIYRWILEVV